MKYFWGLLLLLPVLTFSQTIVGKIENSKGEKIPLANVIIRDSIGTEEILQFVIARNGEYSIVLEENYKEIIIEVTAYKYAPEYIKLANLDSSLTYTRNFTLLSAEDQIEAITIKAKKNPFSEKKDTTIFDVSGYTDGTERKIEEVLKKIPGIQINDKTGEIKYKNQSIETVKLDGDDLFGHNYTIGTRNINVGVVEQIQAIENYSDNHLLKGIEQSNKVILNLKLKKSIDISGDIDFGNGVMAQKKFARDMASNLLAITQKYKAFANISYNNIGINKTPFDYFSSLSYNPEQQKERNFFAKKIIPEQGFASFGEENRSNINNTLFSSYNHIFKLGKRISIKNNFYFISDKISSIQSLNTDIKLQAGSFSTNDENNISKEPIQYRADTDIKINTSSTSLLEYNFKVKQENINTPTKVIQNERKNLETLLKSKDFYLKHHLLFTQKISSYKAFQLGIEQAQNLVIQNYLIQPSIFDSTIYQKDSQLARSQKQFTGVKASLFGTYKKSKYTFIFGWHNEINPLQTSFTAIKQQDTLDIFRNNFTYRKQRFFQEVSYVWQWQRWTFTYLNILSYLHQSIEEDSKQERKFFLIEPKINFRYKINPFAFLNLHYQYKPETFDSEYFYRNPVFLSTRLQRVNTPVLEMQKNHSLGANYYYSDLFNQVQFSCGGDYTSSQGNYFSNLFLEDSRTQILYFFLPQNTNTFNSYVFAEKYFRKIFLLVKYRISYTTQNYKNIVNNSDLRDNLSQFFGSKLDLKTSFNTKINFHNIFFYKQSISRANNSAFINTNLENSLSLIYKQSSRNFAIFTIDYLLPNSQKPSESYWFLDFRYVLKLENKPYEFNFVCKNILNQSVFEQVQTLDFGILTYKTNLLPRYLMLSVACNF